MGVFNASENYEAVFSDSKCRVKQRTFDTGKGILACNLKKIVGVYLCGIRISI